MIPALMLSSQQPVQVSNPSASAGASDKSFSSVLKSSVQSTDETSSNSTPTTAQKNTTNNTTAASSKPAASKNVPPKDAANTTDAPAEKSTQQEPSPSDLSNNMLMQMVLQMAGNTQQVDNNPAGNGVPAEAPGLVVAQVAQGLQNRNGSDASQLLSMPQDQETPSANNETDNATTFLSGISDEASNVQAKAAENLESLAINAQSKNDNMNSGTTVDTAKSDSVLNDLTGKNAAFSLKPAGIQPSDNDNLAQWKMDMSSGQNFVQGPEDKNSPADLKNLSGVYAQMSQVQPSTGHASSTVQETVPVSRLSSMDEIISKAVDSGQKNLILKIDPPDLGSVQIRLSFDNGVLKADVRVDSSAVKDSFNLALPQIKTSLENSGIKISEFNVDVREDQYRHEQERNNQGQQQQRQSRESKNGFFDFFA